ncbi:hypothetical protein FJZ53_03395 [Candidatus Woesearchaeota archaeon]|nr:hypothetical protein [Candidatus Woesearchaeota archaeon]
MEIIPIIGHEYAHSVQVQKWDLSEYEHIKEFSYLEEGHATGVEKYMSIFYMKKENNSAFLYPSTVKNLFNFAEVYLWICKELGVKYKKSLISDKIHKKLSPNQKGITKMPIAHSLGNTFFCLHEATKGDKIYSDVIHRRFEPGLVK